jgi:hypothetical protein
MPELDLPQKLEARNSNSNVERYIYTEASNKTDRAGKPNYSHDRTLLKTSSQQREPLLKSNRPTRCHPLQTDRSVRACQDWLSG